MRRLFLIARNRLTGRAKFISVLAHIGNTVDRSFCIPTLVLASAMAVSAEDSLERPEPFSVVQVANPAAATPPPAAAARPAANGAPGPPSARPAQIPNSDVVDVLRLYEQL